jgi:arabinan endo-1,5-alpha-L-arabinosidase
MSGRRRVVAMLVAAAAAFAAAVVPAAAQGGGRRAPGPALTTATAIAGTYTNPVSKTFADTFADPSVVRGKDGWWYAYGTSDPLREGEATPHRIPVARSADLITWDHVGDAFTAATMPTWAAPDASLWAPDIRYVDGQYRLYYVVTQTTVTAERNDNAIGMATAPTPAGPWTDSGAPVVGPRRGAGAIDDFLWTFDPSVVTDRDGSQWIFYGSYYGGLFAAPLSGDGTRLVGPDTRVAIDNKFEGAYPIWHEGYWYLFASTANCCAGPATGYSVQVGRSRSITGPYVDQQGTPLTVSRAGGTPSLVQNGNRWIGAGHNAVVTDLSGQDWLAYHAIDRADPYLDGTDGINQRPMLIDRLDWVGGWPLARAGRGPSEGAQPAPVTSGPLVTTPADPGTGYTLSDGWQRAQDADSGAFLGSTSAASAVGDLGRSGAARVEADLRSGQAAYGLELGSARLTIDPTAGTAVLGAGGRPATATLPSGFDAADWHAVSLQSDGRTVSAQVSHARLGDPVVVLSVALSTGQQDMRSAAFAAGPGVGVDNLSTVAAATPVRRAEPDRVPDHLDPASSDEFDGADLQPGWRWVRRDPATQVAGGGLVWPTEAADLVGTGNDAGVLLRDPGDGDWAAVAKVSIDLGTDTVRNFQQAGIIAYVDDDQFARLSHVAIWNTRQTEFGHELPYAGRLAYGGTIAGPPAETTWLRLTHTTDRVNGEHELRAWTSRDGTAWVKGGVWTLPAGSDVRVGLVSHGGAGATATFDWFRIYRP